MTYLVCRNITLRFACVRRLGPTPFWKDGRSHEDRSWHRHQTQASFESRGGVAVVKKLAFVAICFAYLGGTAMAQDAKTVIASAKKALGDPTSITYSGSAKDVAFQQCGANAAQMNCQGTHDPMRPITNYVRVIDLNAPASRHTGATNNIGAGGSTTTAPGTFFQQVTPQQADVAQPWAGAVDLYITPWGFLKGAEANNATAKRDGKHTVLSWSPAV